MANMFTECYKRSLELVKVQTAKWGVESIHTHSKGRGDQKANFLNKKLKSMKLNWNFQWGGVGSETVSIMMNTSLRVESSR